jgi:hypothetical protein
VPNVIASHPVRAPRRRVAGTETIQGQSGFLDYVVALLLIMLTPAALPRDRHARRGIGGTAASRKA